MLYTHCSSLQLISAFFSPQLQPTLHFTASHQITIAIMSTYLIVSSMSPMSLYSNKSKLQLLRTELLAMIIEELLQSEDIAALTSLQRISTTFEYLVQKYWVKCKGAQLCRNQPPCLGGISTDMAPCKFQVLCEANRLGPQQPR